MRKRYDQKPRNDPSAPWFYKGERCEPVAFEAEGGKVVAVAVRIKSQPDEIVCEANEAGEFPGLTFAAN